MNKVINIRERHRDNYQKLRESERDYRNLRIIQLCYQSENKLRKIFSNENKKIIKH